MKTHRCKELLEYNKNNQGTPVSIRYGKWFDSLNIDNDYSSWILSRLMWNDEDWDIQYMQKSCRIVYCPFCGKKLENKEENLCIS